MTSLSLLLWIVLGIALQLAIFLAIVFLRHWRDFQTLRGRTAGPEVGPMKEAASGDSAQEGVAWSGFRTFRVDRKVVEDADASICSFYLAPEDGRALPSFLPGQFLTFRLEVPVAQGGSEPIIRCYSLSDAPRPDAYRISVKRVPAPAGSGLPPGRSSNHLHDRVEVGSLLQVRAPAGHFHIDQGDAPVVLIAGGIGITPLLSMLNWCLAEQSGREVWLFYGLRHGGEAVMKSHLEALAATHANFHLWLCFSEPRPQDEAGRDFQHHGRVGIDLLRLHLPLKPYHFYTCGPTPMMESIVTGLEGWGVPASRIHFEAFGPASVKRAPVAAAPIAAAASDILVTFARSGRELHWQPAAGTLLEFAEANGITVDSGCRAGGCGTCQTTIKRGEVTYRQTPDFDPEPGSCLLCVCAPKTSVTLEL
jgi:ferredoxin-NADP reductase